MRLALSIAVAIVMSCSTPPASKPEPTESGGKPDTPDEKPAPEARSKVRFEVFCFGEGASPPNDWICVKTADECEEIRDYFSETSGADDEDNQLRTECRPSVEAYCFLPSKGRGGCGPSLVACQKARQNRIGELPECGDIGACGSQTLTASQLGECKPASTALVNLSLGF